jgi:hypothetical protein
VVAAANEALVRTRVNDTRTIPSLIAGRRYEQYTLLLRSEECAIWNGLVLLGASGIKMNTSSSSTRPADNSVSVHFCCSRPGASELAPCTAQQIILCRWRAWQKTHCVVMCGNVRGWSYTVYWKEGWKRASYPSRHSAPHSFCSSSHTYATVYLNDLLHIPCTLCVFSLFWHKVLLRCCLAMSWSTSQIFFNMITMKALHSLARVPSKKKSVRLNAKKYPSMTSIKIFTKLRT